MLLKILLFIKYRSPLKRFFKSISKPLKAEMTLNTSDYLLMPDVNAGTKRKFLISDLTNLK